MLSASLGDKGGALVHVGDEGWAALTEKAEAMKHVVEVKQVEFMAQVDEKVQLIMGPVEEQLAASATAPSSSVEALAKKSTHLQVATQEARAMNPEHAVVIAAKEHIKRLQGEIALLKQAACDKEFKAARDALDFVAPNFDGLVDLDGAVAALNAYTNTSKYVAEFNAALAEFAKKSCGMSEAAKVAWSEERSRHQRNISIVSALLAVQRGTGEAVEVFEQRMQSKRFDVSALPEFITSKLQSIKEAISGTS